jgi:tetratricopeptide (TPR) repeat protein
VSPQGAAQQLAIANVQLERGDAQGAAERLATLLVDQPDDVSVLLTMARAQLRLKQLDKAMAATIRAIELAPDRGYAFYILSLVLTTRERHAEAIDAARRATTLEPHNPDRHDRLAWALLGAGGRGELPAAREAAETAIRLAPNEAKYRITYGEAALRSGNKDLARRAFTEALALEPENATGLHALGVLDVAMGSEWNLRRIARGAEGLASALRADPRSQNSRLMLEIGLRRFLSRTGVLLVLPAYGGFRLAHDGFLVAGRWLAVAAVLLPLLTAGWFVLRLSRPLRAYLRTVVAGPGQRRSMILAGVAALLLIGAATGPGGLVQWFLGFAALAGLLTRLATTGESNRQARAAGLVVGDYPSTTVLIAAAVIGLVAGLVCLPAVILTGGDPGFVVGLVLMFALAGWSGYVVVQRRRRRPGG